MTNKRSFAARYGSGLTVLMLLCIAVLLSACSQSTGSGKAGEANKAGETKKAVSKEEELAYPIFKKNCVTCHAADLSGKSGENSNLQKVGARLDKEQIVNQIEMGGKFMPPFRKSLTAEEIDHLADWLVTLK